MHSGKPIHRWAFGILAFGVALVAVPPALPQGGVSPGLSREAVWLLEARGRVDVLHADRRLPARANQHLIPADRIQTWTNSQANLLWYDRVHFKVGELSDILIPPPRGANKRSALEVLKGSLYFFHRGPPREFEIKTPTAAAIVVGTEFGLRVEGNGRSVLMLFDGQVDVSNPQGQAQARSGEQVIIEPGQPPRVTPMIQAINDLIQWFLYYPGVLDVNEAGLAPAEEQALAVSLAAYRSGDLTEAVNAYPAGRSPESDAERVYLAALLLAVGQVDKAEAQLTSVVDDREGPAGLAAALRTLISTVKGRPQKPAPSSSSTAALAESYAYQAQGDLLRSLAAATNAAARSPEFGFAWARVAELEFCFGRTKEAQATIERALKLSPRNAEAWSLKGFLLSAQNKVSQAREHFERAIALDARLGNAWLGRGLCRIRQGDLASGKQDLLVAAAVEPQRSVLRSYLGKAFLDAGQSDLAFHELELARRLDTNDPTGWLYSALLREQEGQINDAIRDLEESQTLNRNRRLYRSELLLDRDQAVRSANLARIYRDAGMTEVSVREASRAVNADYANYSAHLFLANSYDQLRDPKQVDLRYETAAIGEYLVAALLAPVGAGPLSPAVSQLDYSKLFEREGLHVSSSTEYLSRGAWTQNASQYGLFGNTSYSLEGLYQWDPGQRPNNDFEKLNLTAQLRQQVGMRDNFFLQTSYQRAKGGDVSQYYDPSLASSTFRFRDTHDPVVLAGWHHEWGPGNHSLLLATRFADTFEINAGDQAVPQEVSIAGGDFLIPNPFAPAAALDYRNRLVGYSVEGQQIWQRSVFTLVAGSRYQTAAFDTHSMLGTSGISLVRNTNNAQLLVPGIPASSSSVTSDLDRIGGYAYGYWQMFDQLLISAGLSYDWVQFPENYRAPPLSEQSQTESQLSPKAGLTWQPDNRTTLRGAYTQSLGSAAFEDSYRLEPVQVAGFNQAFRSLAPESEVGPNIAPAFESFGLSAERRFPTETYVSIGGELNRADFTRRLGVVETTLRPGNSPLYNTSTTRQRIEFEEPVLAVTVNQLIEGLWALGANYRLSLASLDVTFPDIRPEAITQGNLDRHSHREALLHYLDLYALCNQNSGFFAEAHARWLKQDNDGYSPVRPGDDFWQFDLFFGYRFPRRRVEARLGLLNCTDRNYRLNPLNLTTELPRERTLMASVRFNF